MFYVKFGMMSAIFTILGSKDLHSDNIISTNEGPYFIDIEAAITGEMYLNSYSLLAESYLFNSIEKKMIYEGVDLSAFSGGTIISKMCTIKNIGSDDICLGIESCVLEKVNIPKNSNGNIVDPNDYSKKIVIGFKEGMNIFKKYKSDLINEFVKLNDYENRFVLRNTAFYAKYLHDINFPLYTKDVKKTEKYINLLLQRSNKELKVLIEEVNCLKNNIFPYFTSNLFVSTEVFKSKFIERLMDFNEDVISKELNYLNLILKNDGSKKCNPLFSNEKDRIFHEMKTFESFCSNNTLFSYGVIDSSIHDTLMSYRNDLYTFGGSLLFYNKLNNCSEYRKKVVNTVKISYFNLSISGLTGYQSQLMLKYLIGIKEDTIKYISAEEISNPEIVDFSTSGSAILILDYLYVKTLNSDFLKDIFFLGNKYLENIHEHGLTGLFHGYAGDILVLNILSNYFTNRDIFGVVEKTLKLENDLYNKSELNWEDKRKGSNFQKNLCAISYGAGGIIISRLALYRNFRTSDYIKKIAYEDIRKGICSILKKNRSDFVDDTLINGYAGAAVTLKMVLNLNIFEPDDSISKKITNYLVNVKKDLTMSTWRYQNCNTAFFNGRIGTTYALWYISSSGLEESFLDQILFSKYEYKKK